MNEQIIVQQIEQELSKQRSTEEAIKAVVDRLVGEASRELDEFVHTVKEYLDKIRAESVKRKALVEYADDVLELQVLKLPVLMYFAADYMEDWGLYSDVSKAEYQEAYDEAAKVVAEQEGRVIDMELAGRNAAQVQEWVHKVKTRVHSKLKTRLKYADEIYNGLRKVMTKRITEMGVFQREYAKRMGWDYEGPEE